MECIDLLNRFKHCQSCQRTKFRVCDNVRVYCISTFNIYISLHLAEGFVKSYIVIRGRRRQWHNYHMHSLKDGNAWRRHHMIFCTWFFLCLRIFFQSCNQSPFVCSVLRRSRTQNTSSIEIIIVGTIIGIHRRYERTRRNQNFGREQFHFVGT